MIKRIIISTLKYFPFILLVIFSACSFNTEVDYQIRNESGEPITIIVEHTPTRIDTNIIADQTTLTFFNDFNSARNATEYLDNLDAIGFNISIKNASGKVYNKDLMDISNWEKIYPERKHGLGRVRLIVRHDDFD